jgi:hypothetical protein
VRIVRWSRKGIPDFIVLSSQYNERLPYGCAALLMKRSARIRVVADMRERELKAHPSPSANTPLFDRLKILRLKLEDVDAYAFQQAMVLVCRAELYYSDGKHRGCPGGPDALFEAMAGIVNWMRLQAMVREQHPDTDEM